MMSVFTRRVGCDSDCIVECTLMLAMNVNGIGVAVSRCVTRIRSSSRETERTGGGSLVLLTAGPIRQRAATADAPRGAHSRLALGVGSPTLPPSCPPAQTKPSVATAAEELNRSTEALARAASPAVVQIFTTAYVPAGRRRCPRFRPRHDATRLRVGRDRPSRRLHRHGPTS